MQSLWAREKAVSGTYHPARETSLEQLDQVSVSEVSQTGDGGGPEGIQLLAIEAGVGGSLD